MTAWAALISGLVTLVIARNWRHGLLAVLLVGVLQDVFRKLTTGAPAYYILWSTVLYILVFLAALAARALPHYSILYLRDARVRAWLLAFLLILALQLLNSLLRYGNPAIPVLGGLFYLGPLIAMLHGAAFANSEPHLRLFLKAYLLVFVPVSLTVYLSPAYSDTYPVLRDIGAFTGQALRIFDVGTILASNPGLLRSGEIAAWHAATCVMFISILALMSRSLPARAVSVALGLLLVGAIILTGRRKMLVALTIFFALQWGLMLWYRWGLRRIGLLLVALGLVVLFGHAWLEPPEAAEDYLARSQTTYSSVDDRAALTVELARAAAGRAEFFGLGAGAASQGARYAGGAASEDVGGAAEAGVGKVIVELGVPGALVVLLALLAGARALWRQLHAVRHHAPGLLVYDLSFLALVVANLAAFTVASQLYGDFFVLMLLGIVVGFVVRIHDAATALQSAPVAAPAAVPAGEVAD